jgi:hypothetical protein
MCDAMIGAEELSYILSYQTLSAEKIGKVIKRLRSLLKTMAHMCAISG